MQGKVSMVVPCYNKKDYIGAMLQSVCNQVWDNVELILVNDGSTDGTREIISEWEPKILGRGYEVVIIDQENGGCCAAVYAGLLRMTGDYFCLVDCDDEIAPEYVSRMAGWLDEHDDFEWAACNYRLVEIGDNCKRELPPWRTAVGQDATPILQNYLLWRNISMTWIYMVRMRYVRISGLIDAFCTERRKSYEPCILIPLSAAGGKLKFFDEPLYLFNQSATELSRAADFNDEYAYQKDYLYLIEWALERTNMNSEDKSRYITLARLMHICTVGSRTSAQAQKETLYLFAKNATRLIDELITPAPQFTTEEILEIGFPALFLTLKLRLSGILSGINGLSECRIIGCGAKGRVAKRLIPALKNLPLYPTEFWDAEATGNELINGTSLKKPSYDSLHKNDILIVFPSGSDMMSEIRKWSCLSDSVALYYDDLRGYLELQKIPKLMRDNATD